MTLSFERSMVPRTAGQPELLAAKSGIVPGLERAQYLAREGLVYFVEVEIREVEIRVLQHARHRECGRHQQAFLLRHVVDGGNLAVAEIRKHGQVALARPLFGGEQHGRGAVRHRRRVARGERAGARPVEDGLELCELLETRIGANVVVPRESQIVHHQILVEAGGVGRGGLLMALQRELILLAAADVPGLHHQLGALAHAQPGARLGDPGEHRAEVPGPELEPRREAATRALAAIALEQELLKTAWKDHGRIADRIHARGDGVVDLAQRDFVTHEDGRLETGAAGALQVEARRFRGEPGAQHRFAREVPLARMLHHRAGRHVVETLAQKAVTLGHAAQHRREHLLVADSRVRAVAACEWNSHPADDCDPPRTCPHQHAAPPKVPSPPRISRSPTIITRSRPL